MSPDTFAERAGWVAEKANELAGYAKHLAEDASRVQVPEVAQQAATQAAAGGEMSFLALFTIFVLACFVGFYVVWSVTPALHSPLMAVTNAISSVIIVGGLIAAGPMGLGFSKIMGLLAVTLAAVNIFGGFIVTQRMLGMFKKKKR